MKTPEQIFDEAIKAKGLDIVSVKDSDLYEAGLHAITQALMLCSVVSNQRELLRDKEVKCFDCFLELYCEKKDNGKWLYRDSLWSFDYIINKYQELYKNP